MTKKDTAPPATGAPGDDAKTLNRMPVVIHGQYLKDLSIENPHAPESMQAGAARPTMDINFSMDARKVDEAPDAHLFEVTLGVEATARREDKIAFLVQIEYAVLVSLHDVPEDQAHPLLLIEMPRYAFPFVRQIVADLTQQAGFPPLLLQPVDFREFYMQRYAQNAAPTVKSA